MTRVQITHTITGTRNGDRWPPIGDIINLPDAEADSLVSMGMATVVKPAEKSEKGTAVPGGEKR